MPRGDKSAYNARQKRQAEHIEESYEDRGVSKEEAERRAWATVNKQDGGALPGPKTKHPRRSGAAARAGEKGAGGGGHVRLPHQAFADQEGRNADPAEAGEVVRRVEPAFADHDAAGRHLWRQFFADRERGLEGAQITVVDADQAGTQREGALKLIFLMNLNKNIHAI